MPTGSTISIRWVLDVVDKGGPDKLLAQDRAIRSSLNQTDTAYKRTASTAVSASSKQAEASRAVTGATEKEGRARLAVSDTLSRYNAAQRDALAIGSRVLSQIDKTTGAYSRQAGAAKRLADEEARRSRASRTPGRGAEASALSGLGGVVSGVGGLARNTALGVFGTATGLTVEGLKRGTQIRAGAAGLAGLTGLDPRTATALAVIAQAEQVQARGLGQAFSTLGKQVTGFQHELSTGKPGKATEAFKQLGIGPGQVAGLQNNLPGLFDLVFRRAQGLPAAQQATVLKTFLGRGATLAGQVELGGPLQKQIGTVREQLGGLDPKKLQDLHESEIRLKEATVGLELSFASTFGPPLISLMNKVAPAIKPIGEALRTAVTVPLEAAKKVLPDVISGIKEGLGIEGAKPPRNPTVGTRGREHRVQQGGSPTTEPPKAQTVGETIGSTLKEVKTYSEQLLKALEPAAPFLENVLLPAAEGFGKGMVAAFKLFLAISGPVSKVLGAVGSAVKPLRPLVSELGGVLGIVLAGPVLRSLGDIPKLGGAFKLMAAPLGLAGKGIGGFGKALTGIGGVLTKTGNLFDKFPGKLGSIAGGMTRAAGAVVTATGKGFGKLADVMTGTLTGAGKKATEGMKAIGPKLRTAASSVANAAGSAFGGLAGKMGSAAKGAGEVAAARLGSVAGKVKAAAKGLIVAAASGLASLGGKLVSVVSAAGARMASAAAEVGAAAGTALQAAFLLGIAALGVLLIKRMKEFFSEVKVKVDPGAIFRGESPIKLVREPNLKKVGEERDAIQRKKGLGRFGYLEEKRRGGIIGYQGGGFVDAMVSPGEQVLYGGSSWTVPGPRTASDSVYAQLPVGAAVLTSDGQQRMAMGSSLSEAIATQAPHFRTGGFVSTAYGPPWGGIEGGGTTATGIDLSKSPHLYIVAVDPSVIPLHSKLKISPNPFGYAGAFSAEDTGGAIKGNRIDFYDWKGRADQDRWGVRHVNVSTGGKGGPIGAAKGTENVTQALSLGRSRVRAGLVPDALQQGIEAGAAGLTAEEVARANRGARGAEGSPLSKAIAEALGATTREVKTRTESGSATGSGKLPTGVSVPNATWNPSRKPIDRWIQPYLSYGAGHGWPGVVTSGFRTKAEGERIYASGVRPAAKPGTSKHEQANYPGGAVDVTDASTLAAVLAKRKGPHLLQWAGSRDPVHFSHPVGGSYRRGGIVGFAKGGRVAPVVGKLSAVAGNATAFGAVLRSYEESLAGLTINRLNQLVRTFTASARKGGRSAVVQSFQALISAVEGQIGLRIGELRAAITKRGAAVERGAASVTRYLAFRGVDPTGQEGLKVQIAADSQAVAARKRSVAEAKQALHIAKRTGNPKAIEEATEELTKSQEDLQEAVVKGVEDGRSLAQKATEDIRNSAQEIVDLAGSSVQFAQGSLTGLDTAQRLNRTAETPGGENQKASAIQSELLPVLQGAKQAAENQLQVLKATGASATEIATSTLAVQSAGNEIASAMAEAAELVRKAAEQAAEELVEAAQHKTNLDTLAGTHKELEERIAGTYEAGGQNRADFIRNTLIPDLQGEIAALVSQQKTAEEQGNPKLASQIAEAIASKQNGLLEDQLQATEDVAANTNPNHKVGGQLGLTFGGESLSDSLIAVGSGA
jgi:3D (Asp-Asp-Asp) domain-containing protein